MSISPNVVIMTKAELLDYRDEWFDKGVQRGRFEERCDQSQAKATEGKAGNAEGAPLVRQTTTGTGLRVGAASADLPATSEFMDVTAGETAPSSDYDHGYADGVEWATKQYAPGPSDSAPNHQPHAVSQALRAYQALFEPPESDAYDNLTGALYDIKRHIEAGKPTDEVCVHTIVRVLDQIATAYTALRSGLDAHLPAPPSPAKTGGAR